MKPKLLVSACLLGTPCRYDGKSKKNEAVCALAERFELIPVCPEVLGGLPTPRTPSERRGACVVRKDGRDVTAEYRRGAEYTGNKCVGLSTASPFKFPAAVLAAIGGNVTGDEFADMAALSRMSGRAAPENLASLRSLPVRHTDVINRADLTRYVSDILSNGGFDSI